MFFMIVSRQILVNARNLHCKNHSINVITSSNKETFFDVIDHIEYSDFKKKKYLIVLRDLVLDKLSDNRSIKPFDMTNVLNKFKQPIKPELTLQSILTELL